jgi:hypothetical protein
MTIILSALATELLTDPVSLGYSPYVAGGNYDVLAYMLNSVSANSNVATSAVMVGKVDVETLQECVVGTEYSSLSQTPQNLWDAIIRTGTEGVCISNVLILGQLSYIWSGTTTQGNISALRTHRCSRGETLFGHGEVVETDQADKAVNGNY